MKVLVLLSLIAVACQGASLKQQRRFPDDFIFGCATASYQIEGAWNEDGIQLLYREEMDEMERKGENIWDHLTHTNPAAIMDQSNGDIAANSYHNYKRDVEIMRELGLDAYRFSLSWSRILPTGFTNEVNPAGIAYYNNLINEMLKYNIQPLVTLYHWDLPLKLQELGGFANPLIATWFEDYARVAYENFGDRVKFWITFNEPREICHDGYGITAKAPMLNSTAMGTYLCAKNLALAHANAYHAYNNDFKPTQGGECGITISVNWYEADTDSAEDKFAAEIQKQSEWGLYAEPIFSEHGGFPKDLADKIAKKSTEQGFPWSRLPAFTEEEKAWVRGTSDFFGVNHYTGWLISATNHKGPFVVPSLDDDRDIGAYKSSEWITSASSWLTQVPDSIFNVLSDLNARYNSPVFYITENGWSTLPEQGLIDDDRATYYRAALESVLDCLDAGIKLKGYMAWSMLDNFEWLGGYVQRFGIYEVDFEDPARTRTPRKSAFVYKHIVTHRYIDHDYEPETMTMTIDEGH